MTRADDYEIIVLETLRRVAAETLERKRRLGQYAVVWRNGRVVCIGPDAPPARDPSGAVTASATGDVPKRRKND